MKIATVLFLILVLAAGLRCYNLDFPSIGYHGGKEHEYLSMAQEMLRTGDFVTRRIYYYGPFDDVPIMRLYPQPPIISYQIIAAWKIFGQNLWSARLFNVFFGIGSVLVMYFISRTLFVKNRYAALFSAFMMATLPLPVFFSRNLQPESPGLFFMSMGNLFYLKFITTFKKRNILFGGLAISMAWIYKFNFLISAMPLLFCLPYLTIFREKKRELLKYAVVAALSYLLIPCTVLLLKHIGQWEFTTLGRVRIFEIFTPAYWQKYGRMIWWYIKGENFGPIYVTLAASGIVMAFFRRRGLLNRYIIGWALTIIPYCMVLSDLINQHNYYQVPFLMLVCVSTTYSVVLISELLGKLIKKDLFVLCALAVAVGAGPFAYDSLLRMHSTIYAGMDVAGESLAEFTKPGDRVFLLTHSQGYGIARYAKRYAGWEDDLEKFKEREAKFNIRYACFYPAEYALSLQNTNPKLFEYIRDNYRVKEVGVVEEPRRLFYIILEKGKNPDPATFLQSFSGAMRLRTIYRVVGKYIFFYSIRPDLKTVSPSP
ncbi:MAG: glycosyltransferase family 39 protein [Candidatus Omnitrophica bacterium]|nr:glycosyltransferase family 39 protein [Candidatus Omnitrophota bacterium]